ncbi:MAG: alpha/beta fold hydrolase [Anaeromyxobacteraceae bacterium]
MTPIVFLPGAAGRPGFWRPVAEHLADLGPTHLLGYPGFAGLPPNPALASLDDLYRWVVARLPAGPFDVVAQSMGGVLAARLALDEPGRVRRLVLAATSGGLDVASLGAADWRPDYRAALPDVPPWFLVDRTDLSARLPTLRAPTLLLWSDADPVSPLAVGEKLRATLPHARLEVIRGGDHGFGEARADEVAALVRAFLG